MAFMPRKKNNHESGFVLISAMLFLLILTIVGVMATNTTTVELQIAGNDRIAKQDFYNQEANLTNGQLRWTDWLSVMLAGDDSAFFPPLPTTAPDTDINDNGYDDISEYTDSNGNVVGVYKVRKIISANTAVATWDDIANYATAAEHPANQAPLMAHNDKPPVGSGYGTNLRIARYVITSYSTLNARNAIIQAGVYKVFQESNQ